MKILFSFFKCIELFETCLKTAKYFLKLIYFSILKKHICNVVIDFEINVRVNILSKTYRSFKIFDYSKLKKQNERVF